MHGRLRRARRGDLLPSSLFAVASSTALVSPGASGIAGQLTVGMSCSYDNQCNNGYCDATSKCVARKTFGTVCSGHDECENSNGNPACPGNCVDNPCKYRTVPGERICWQYGIDGDASIAGRFVALQPCTYNNQCIDGMCSNNKCDGCVDISGKYRYTVTHAGIQYMYEFFLERTAKCQGTSYYQNQPSSFYSIVQGFPITVTFSNGAAAYLVGSHLHFFDSVFSGAEWIRQ